MAITLEANYSKKLGLPQYSSHQYSVTVRTEVSDLSQIDEASSRLYRQLQEAVDRDIQSSGFLPDAGDAPRAPSRSHEPEASHWNCSAKQQGLIEKLIQEHKLKFPEVDRLAKERFRRGITQLNKMQASGLIDELIDTYGTSPRSYARSGNRGGRR